MIRVLFILVSVIVTSFYLFPFEFKFLAGMNTKMIMAGLALIAIPFELSRKGEHGLPRWLVVLSLWAGVVSVFGLLAVVINQTRDMTYATYVVSMWVWLGGAYLLNLMYKYVHGNVTVRLVINYLVAVCVGQCALALMIDSNASVKDFIDGLVAGVGYMGVNENRLYGLGASLDVAGIRFGSVLIMIGALMAKILSKCDTRWLEIVLFASAFFFIGLVGNMMARTTTIGIAAAMVTFVLVWHINGYVVPSKTNVTVVGAISIIALCIVIYYYNVNDRFYENVRFGFEGFFSLAETGEWNVHSNDILQSMIVWPDNIKTWLIGDGYIENPYIIDQYYIGQRFGGYYMNTDIGYLRFIFYFGIFGTLAFIAFMWRAAKYCVEKFPEWKIMFWMLLLLNYVVWCKVSTDIFSVFAIFLTMYAASQDKNQLEETQKTLPE